MPPAGINYQTVRVGKIPFLAVTMQQAIDIVVEAGRQAQPVSICLSNAYCVALASQDREYSNLMNTTGLNFPDGAPVVWSMNARRRSSKASRVRGPSLFKDTLDATRRTEIQHFFLGTTEDTLAKLTSSVAARFPGVQIAGSFSPPFAPIDESMIQECAQAIDCTDANIVWVALGTPKQDFLAHELSIRTGRPCIAVGAAFDFVAGTVKEAPTYIQNSGFEWAYRLAMEPRRLWRRYLIGNLRFIFSALFQSRRL